MIGTHSKRVLERVVQNTIRNAQRLGELVRPQIDFQVRTHQLLRLRNDVGAPRRSWQQAPRGYDAGNFEGGDCGGGFDGGGFIGDDDFGDFGGGDFGGDFGGDDFSGDDF